MTPPSLDQLLSQGSESFRRLNGSLVIVSTNEPCPNDIVGIARNRARMPVKAKSTIKGHGATPQEVKWPVLGFWKACGLPEATTEHRFHDKRRFRFDYAWIGHRVALEVNGGVFSGGRHVRGTGFVRDMEKASLAASLGWRILYCQPKDLNTAATADLIAQTLACK